MLWSNNYNPDKVLLELTLPIHQAKIKLTPNVRLVLPMAMAHSTVEATVAWFAQLVQKLACRKMWLLDIDAHMSNVARCCKTNNLHK